MNTEAKDGIVEDEPPNTTDMVRSFRNPQIPVTLNDLASMKGDAIAVLDARVQILNVARDQALKMTSPEDWVLFKAPDNRVTGYLQDAGCDRIRDILGIEIFNVSEPKKETSPDAQSFMYLITGDGRSKLTLQVVERMEGGRMSTDDFCRDKNGVALELAVRKAARANLDGNIVRELAGLKSVPEDELTRAWNNTHKKIEHCRKGRGFGTTQERSGAQTAGEVATADLVPPTCDVCNAVAVVRTSAKGPFYACPNYRKHEDRRWSMDVEKWKADPRSKKPATAAASAPEPTGSEDQPQQPQAPKQQPTPPPLTDSDIPFGGGSNPPRGRR